MRLSTTHPLLRAPDGSERAESPFAHIGVPDGTWATLCGYVPVREGTKADARERGLCVVCAALWERAHGEPYV